MSTLTFIPQVNLECIKEGFTQSELSLKDECALKWNFRYNNRLERNEFQWSFFVGAAWHNFQQKWREKKGEIDLTKIDITGMKKGVMQDSEFDKWLEYWSQVIPAYQQAYAQIYFEEANDEWLIIEQELEATVHGYRIRGKIDLASAKYMFIRDFKTTVSTWLTSPQGWHFKLQFMTYCWLMYKNFPNWQKSFNFQLETMQKPRLKQTKEDGTWTGHIRRVCQDIKERAAIFYLQRQQVTIQPENIRHFEETVLKPKIELLHLAIENPEAGISIVTNPNTNACNSFGKQCEFFEICEKGFNVGRHFFHQRDKKHNEL